MKNKKTIFAPWRIEYLKLATKSNECILCSKPKEKKNKENLILEKGKKVFVIMNLFPYNSGHLMIAPYRHTNEFENLKESEYLEIIKLSQIWIKVIKELMQPQGFNLGINLGKCSGAGIDEHLHFHIVPRWNGDTNFMPVIADTKVMPENLSQTYDKLLLTRFNTKNNLQKSK